MDGWKTIVSFWVSAHFQELLFSGRGSYLESIGHYFRQLLLLVLSVSSWWKLRATAVFQVPGTEWKQHFLAVRIWMAIFPTKLVRAKGCNTVRGWEPSSFSERLNCSVPCLILRYAKGVVVHCEFDWSSKSPTQSTFFSTNPIEIHSTILYILPRKSKPTKLCPRRPATFFGSDSRTFIRDIYTVRPGWITFWLTSGWIVWRGFMVGPTHQTQIQNTTPKPLNHPIPKLGFGSFRWCFILFAKVNHHQIPPFGIFYTYIYIYVPRCSMYGVFTYIYPLNNPNVGK